MRTLILLVTVGIALALPAQLESKERKTLNPLLGGIIITTLVSKGRKKVDKDPSKTGAKIPLPKPIPVTIPKDEESNPYPATPSKISSPYPPWWSVPSIDSSKEPKPLPLKLDHPVTGGTPTASAPAPFRTYTNPDDPNTVIVVVPPL